MVDESRGVRWAFAGIGGKAMHDAVGLEWVVEVDGGDEVEAMKEEME